METLKLDNNSSKQGILTMKGGRLTFIHHAEQKGSGFCLYYLGRANEKDGMTTLPRGNGKTIQPFTTRPTMK
jgi:hypothetical protein